jgi:UDPglucose 6-dehydrogenase
MDKRIGIVGQGFVGNAIFQKFKDYFEVLTNDLDESKSNSSKENLVFKCNTIFLCLPTPMNADGSCNVDILERELTSIDLIADNQEVLKTIVIKSTVTPGTTAKWNEKYEALNIVFNPEFLTERTAVKDFENTSRIVLGGPRPATTELKQIYTNVFPKATIVKTDSTHAEMVKYMTNTFLSVKVSYANEIYKLCGALGIDYDKVVEYATYDERLGKTFWAVPGTDGDFGYGGHCFPKDLAALISVTNKHNTVNNVLTATQQTNDEVRENRDWEGMKGRAVI